MASTFSAVKPMEPLTVEHRPQTNSVKTKIPTVTDTSHEQTINQPIEVDTRADRATSMEDVQKAVATLQAAVDVYAPSMSIGFDGELNKMIVRVTDAETNEVIRELPPEELLDIARFLERNGVDAVGSESLRGMLLDEYI